MYHNKKLYHANKYIKFYQKVYIIIGVIDVAM